MTLSAQGEAGIFPFMSLGNAIWYSVREDLQRIV